MRSILHAFAALVAGSIATTAHAQTVGGVGDSVAQHEAARDAQAAFERNRYHALPWTWRRAESQGDEVVGRLVLLDDDGRAPPPDPERVRAERTTLIEALDRLAARRPGDDWILGQRTYYRIEAGDTEGARAALSGCRAIAWWCRALEGLVDHRAERFSDSERSFEAALRSMPDSIRARWTDLAPLLDSESQRAYRSLDAAGRRAFEDRFWMLADPLYLVPGNDRRTEHFSRHVLDRILSDARTPFAIRWGDDLREVLIRYGWPVSWERTRPRGGSLGWSGRGGVIGHDPPGERRFVPDHDALEDPYSIRPEGWALKDDGAQTTYAPAYADTVHELAHQLAVFRRGATAVVVAGWDASGAPAAVDAALFVVGDRGRRHARSEGAGPRGTLDLRVPASPAIVSLELLSADSGYAARVRYGLPLGVRRRPVSDLLLIDGPAVADLSLDLVAARARGTTSLRSGESMTLFWELYVPAASSSVAYSLAVRDERGGFWRGLGAAIGIGGDEDSVALEWREPISASAAVVPRALRIELPDLPDGAYSLELSMTIDEGSRHTVRRPFVIESD